MRKVENRGKSQIDLIFWILLNLYFDPGGYISGFLGGNLFGRFNITDIIIVGILMVLYNIKPRFSEINSNLLFNKFIKLLLFYFAYYYIVFGFISPYLHKDLDYMTFFMKNRNMIYGLIILYATYFFSLRGIYYFYKVTLIFGVVSLTLYLITIVTGFGLIPVIEMERYSGSGMKRLIMGSYGLFYYLFPIAVIVLQLSRNKGFFIKYKSLLYYAGVLMLLTLLFTLSRRVIVDVVGMVLIIVLLITKVYRSAKFTSMMKFIIPAFIFIVVMIVIKPSYLNYISIITQDTFSLLTTGKDTRGEGDYRLEGSGDMENVKASIKENIWIGNGYTYLYWGGENRASSPRGMAYARMADAAREVPIYGVFFNFGILGVFLILLLYYKLFKLFLFIFRSIKKAHILRQLDPYMQTLTFLVLLTIIKMFTIKIMGFGGIFGSYSFPGMAVIFGLTFAINQRINSIYLVKGIK